jgi:hypothetical protein
LRIPDRIHEELLNWSRWCWQGQWPHPLPATQCGSLESQYRAPPDWNPDDAPLQTLPRPNERNAKRVQAVYDKLLDECEMAALVLKAEYPGRAERGNRTVAAHKLGLTVPLYDAWFQVAVNRVEAAFEVCA